MALAMETKKCAVVSNEQLHLQSFRIFAENSEKRCGFISSGTLHQTAWMTVQLPAEVQYSAGNFPATSNHWHLH